MSRIVSKYSEEIKHIVQDKNGEKYLVSSVWIGRKDRDGNEYETMVFRWDSFNWKIANWAALYKERYKDEIAMASKHYDICCNLEEYI